MSVLNVSPPGERNKCQVRAGCPVPTTTLPPQAWGAWALTQFPLSAETLRLTGGAVLDPFPSFTLTAWSPAGDRPLLLGLSGPPLDTTAQPLLEQLEQLFKVEKADPHVPSAAREMTQRPCKQPGSFSKVTELPPSPETPLQEK